MSEAVEKLYDAPSIRLTEQSIVRYGERIAAASALAQEQHIASDVILRSVHVRQRMDESQRKTMATLVALVAAKRYPPKVNPQND